MSLPKQLDFSQVKPLGFPTKMRLNRFQPQGNLQQFNVNDAIRFIINTKGYWDPYSAYFQFDIDFEDIEEGNVLQLDGSAHSLIRTLIVKTGTTEVERIEEYDVLGQYLTDMHYDIDGRSQQLNQGTGFHPCGYKAGHGEQVNRQITFATADAINGNPAPSTTLFQKCEPTPQTVDFQTIGGNFAPNIPPLNTFFGPVWQTSQQGTWYGATLYRDFESGTLTNTQITNSERLKFTESGMMTVTDSIDQPIKANQRVEQKLIEDNYMMSPGTTKADGTLEIDYSYSFAGSCFEPRYSKTFEQNCIINGVPTKKKITRATYCIPILSGLLGILMPRKSYKLLPMEALKDLVIELQLNQYAYFSSGYPKQQTPQTGMVTPAFRRDTWSVKKCEIVVEMIEMDKAIDDAVRAQLQQGIVLHSNSWMKGPTFSFNANESPQGNYQINQGYESLRSIVITMHPLDYQMYPFCRKSYRLSQNLQYLQIKVGLDYYPSLAIQGHGGNNLINPDKPTDLNNSEFMINLDKAFGKYVDIIGEQYVNTANFALNDRNYDPTNIDAWKDANGNITNTDTANGAPHYHENSCVGKAIYALDLESLSYDPDSISGLNTTKQVPYELILKSDQLNAFSRKSEMHIFNHYDFIVKFSPSGTEVVGRV